MAKSLDRFLRHNTAISEKAALGRSFSVTRETWRLTDDPRAVNAKTEVLANRRTASDAADIARAAAATFSRHGFHRPSGSWWGADDARFHRFVVHAASRRATAAVVVASGLAGLLALALLRPSASAPSRRAPPSAARVGGRSKRGERASGCR